MSKIKLKIEESRASIINAEIAAILVLEFTEQISLGNTFLPDGVETDYIHAITSADAPFVGVMYSGSKTDQDFQNYSDVTSQYLIECKAKGYPTGRKIAEVVRAILMNSEYRTLGLPPGYGIKGTSVRSRDMSIFDNRRSSQDDITAYVVFNVRHVETTEKVTGIPLAQDQVKAVRGDKSLYYTKNLTE